MWLNNTNLDIIPEEEQELMKALLSDLVDINRISEKTIFIDWQDYHDEYPAERVDPWQDYHDEYPAERVDPWQDYHDEYPAERVDPCPDYYGFYTIRDFNNPFNIIGIPMTIDELDSALCLLYNFLK